MSENRIMLPAILPPELKLQVKRRSVCRHLQLKISNVAYVLTLTAPLKCSVRQINAFLQAEAENILSFLQKSGPAREHYLKLLQNKEVFYLFGQECKRYVVRQASKTAAEVKQEAETYTFYVPQAWTQEAVATFMHNYFRRLLMQKISDLRPELETRLGLTASYHIRRMKTRWGTCNVAKAKININNDLLLFPVSCLEYVLCHELLHLKERRHNRHFYELLTEYCPDWRASAEILCKRHYLCLLDNL